MELASRQELVLRVRLRMEASKLVSADRTERRIQDESMNLVRRAYFDQSCKLITQFKGRDIETIGDSFIAFKSADAALD